METNKHLESWNKLRNPPSWALKKIVGGRLKGFSDINPQWRYQVMTEVYGPCGIGWKFDIVRLWTEPGPDNQVFAFAQINLYTHKPDETAWSAPIPGIGGHMLIPREKDRDKDEKGATKLHANDEAYKMAVTDALSTAMKMLGVAADVYAGAWDGSKYKEREEAKAPGKVLGLTDIQNSVDICNTVADLEDLWGMWAEEINKASNKKEVADIFVARKKAINKKGTK